MCGEAQDHLSRISTLWEPLLKAGYQGLRQHAAEIPAAEKNA